MPGNLICDQCEKHIGDYSNAYFSDWEKDLDFCSEKCQLEWKRKNWKDIHEDFSLLSRTYQKPYQQIWEEQSINYQEAREWIKVGFKPHHYVWVEEWKDHGFSPQETKLWKENNLTYQDAKEWISVGFSLVDHFLIKKWKYHNFTLQQARMWREIGLDKDDYELATYLRYEKVQPNQTSNLKQLKRIFNAWLKKAKSAREYLDCFYPLNQRSTIKYLNLSKKNLIGALDLSDFPNLEILTCRYNQLTSLNLTNCLKLREISCSNNNLKQDLSTLRNLVNLEALWIYNNPFSGSLKSLRNLNKLNYLDISNTDIDSGLEYLPESVKIFSCLVNERKDAKVKAIFDLFANEKGEVETEEYYYIKNFPQKLKKYKEKLIQSFQKQSTINLNDEPELLKFILKSFFEFPNAQEFNCKNCHFIQLDLSKFPNLEKLNCSSNELTTLNITHLDKLGKLDCSNNQITDIILPSDLKSLETLEQNLTEINLDNNPMTYVDFDRKFKLGKLASLTKNEIKEVDKKQLAERIKQKIQTKVPSKIEDIQCFSTWWNPNCVLVLNKAVWYAVRLAIYEPTEKKMPEIIKIIKISEHIYKDKAKAKIEELKEKLNGDNPILVIYPRSSFSPKKLIKKIELPEEIEENPDNYLKPTDMIWRAMENIPIIDCYHVAIYLGKERVAHIGTSKFVRASKIKENKSLLGARVDSWQDFLKSNQKPNKEADKLIRYHPVIPFKKPEMIQEQIKKAISTEYGAEEYSFLGNNCEHFATLVVCGVPFSTQTDKVKLLLGNINLEKEMIKSNEEFEKMSNSQKLEGNQQPQILHQPYGIPDSSKNN